MSSRRSRWGDSNRRDSGGRRHHRDNDNRQRSQPTQVTDDDALKALLASANDRKRQRENEGKADTNRRPDGRNNDHRRDDRNNDNSRDRRSEGNRSEGRRKRWGSRPEHDDKRRRRDDDDHHAKETAPPAEAEPVEKPKPKHKANFGLSGALAKDTETGGKMYKGVLLKFQEPAEARAPNTQWRFYVFEGKDTLETLHISKQSAYLIGGNVEIADIPFEHESLSEQHAVLQYRALPLKSDPTRVSCQPYIMDLESESGTFLNGVKIDSARYYQLRKGDVVTFGRSKREYVLMTENTTSVK
mmetsp:Transcript_16143/g.44723  ORF Transcript_16143/g.44723 Transcript_16143/m.44723 type:complete len:300 (-) Transcript_16143:154-1053(-)